jgi:hypothetical protein
MKHEAPQIPLGRLGRLTAGDRAALEKQGVLTVQQFYALVSAPQTARSICSALRLTQTEMDALMDDAAALLPEPERSRLRQFRNPAFRPLGALRGRPDRPETHGCDHEE